MKFIAFQLPGLFFFIDFSGNCSLVAAYWEKNMLGVGRLPFLVLSLLVLSILIMLSC